MPIPSIEFEPRQCQWCRIARSLNAQEIKDMCEGIARVVRLSRGYEDAQCVGASRRLCVECTQLSKHNPRSLDGAQAAQSQANCSHGATLRDYARGAFVVRNCLGVGTASLKVISTEPHRRFGTEPRLSGRSSPIQNYPGGLNHTAGTTHHALTFSLEVPWPPEHGHSSDRPGTEELQGKSERIWNIEAVNLRAQHCELPEL